jgi:hypothetical protein
VSESALDPVHLDRRFGGPGFQQEFIRVVEPRGSSKDPSAMLTDLEKTWTQAPIETT